MKRIVFLKIFCFGGLFLMGCRNNNLTGVAILSSGRVPPNLAGTWKGDKSFWEISIDSKGKITSAKIHLGGVEIKPGQTKEISTYGGGKGIFQPGIWTIEYRPQTRYLTIKIAIDYFYQDMGKFALEGEVSDLLSGPISEDFSFWDAEWHSWYTYIVHLDETKELAHIDKENAEFRGKLKFRKIVNK